MRLLLLLGLLLTACATTSDAHDLGRRETLFAAPKHGFTIPARGEQGWSMERLVLEYGRATNQRCLFNARTLARLQEWNVPLETELVVQPDQVHGVVAALLFEMKFSLSVTSEENPRFISVHLAPSSGHVGPEKLHPLLIPVSEIDLWAEHPAYIVRTIVTLKHANPRLLSNVLRAFLHASEIERVIALTDSRQLLFQGTAGWVAGQVRAVQVADQAAYELSAKPGFVNHSSFTSEN